MKCLDCGRRHPSPQPPVSQGLPEGGHLRNDIFLEKWGCFCCLDVGVFDSLASGNGDLEITSLLTLSCHFPKKGKNKWHALYCLFSDWHEGSALLAQVVSGPSGPCVYGTCLVLSQALCWALRTHLCLSRTPNPMAVAETYIQTLPRRWFKVRQRVWSRAGPASV